MYQSHLYLEVRILVLGSRRAFTPVVGDSSFSIEDSVINKIVSLAKAFECKWCEKPYFERITGNIQVPTEYNLSGLSVKLAEKGFFDIDFHSRQKRIEIEEIRLEEDAGRLTHSDGKPRMDYSNAGMPSIRIKTSDVLELGEEAFLFLDELRRLLQYLHTGTGEPVENLIRCNAYVALAKYPNNPDYYVKLRNLNSFNFVRKAINSELSRQEEILISGGNVISESRLWNERQNITEPYKARSVNATRKFISVASNIVPVFTMSANSYNISVELPEARRKRLCKVYGLSRPRAEFICDEKARADFFEESIKYGVDPMDAAHWITSEISRILKRSDKSTLFNILTPKRFAYVLKLFSEHKIHSGIAKQLLQRIIETDKEPENLLKENNWVQITDLAELLPLVQQVISENPTESDKLRTGDMAPLEFLTGLIMKKTDRMADPVSVKLLLKRELNINVVYILTMGGAICGKVRKDGSVTAAESVSLDPVLSGIPKSVYYQVVSLGHILSEEIEPGDWAVLISEIALKIAAGTANGIVIAHGTDTLSYTAALLYWLFSDAGVPVVLTASSCTPDTSDEAQKNMTLAVETACKEKKGVFVVFNQKILSPLNLKFIKPSPDGFSNWNLQKPVFTNSGPLAMQFSGFTDLDPFVLKQVLREAADSMLVCRIYPGFRADLTASLIDQGITHFILEMYETGTGSMRGCDYSLKSLLLKGRKKDCRFYCTSQQACKIDFSGYTTSRRVWREGAIPMGTLTTESTVALYFAVSLVADSREEFDQFMEVYSELYES